MTNKIKNLFKRKNGPSIETNAKVLTLIFSIFALAVLSLSFISAVGVSTPYWSTNPLKLQPGESTTITLALQNMVGDKDVILRANITKGNNIATIVEESSDYRIPIGRNDIPVNIFVSVSEDSPIDQIQDVEVSFVQVSSDDEEGFFTVASAFTQRIPVLVVGEPTESVTYGQNQEKTNPFIWVILGLLCAIIVVGIVINRARK